MTTETKEDPFSGWAVCELMGHRRLGGMVSEQTIAGKAFLRVDVPDDGEGFMATQFYSPDAVYCLTPCGEAEARAVARANRPQPVQRWEMPTLPAPEARPPFDEYHDDDDR